MIPKLRASLGLAVAAGLALLLVPQPSRAQVIVKASDTVNFRLGFQIQPWAEWLQDRETEGYQQGFKIRRVRFILAGQVAKNVTFFFQTDNANMGNSVGSGATKSLNTGFVTQDAFLEWRPMGNDLFVIDAGKMLMPLTRNSLQSTSSHLSWDGGAFTFLQSGPLQNDAGRDVGFQAKTYLVNDHLEFRAGIFDGFRTPNSAGTPPVANTRGSRNSFRFTGRAVYNFFDTEKGYVPVGTNLGKKKIVAIGGGYDTQGDYKAYGGDFMIDWPFGPGDAKVGRDAVTAHVDYIRFDGGSFITALPKQDEIFFDLGYFAHVINLQPFIRFEWDGLVDNVTPSRNQRRYGGGFNYYVTPAAQNMKITVGYERIVPNAQPATAKVKNQHHFLMQLQIVYF